MYSTPLNFSRPVREFDGEGFSERMGTTFVIYSDPLVGSEGEMTLMVQEQTDVRVGDLVEIPYNITRIGA